MSIDCQCQCGATYRLKDSRAGDTFKCKACPASFVVPRPRSAGEPPAVGPAEVGPVEATAVLDQQALTVVATDTGRWQRRSDDPYGGFGEVLNPEAIAAERPAPPGPHSAGPSLLSKLPSPGESLAAPEEEALGDQDDDMDMASIYASSMPSRPMAMPDAAPATRPHPPASWWVVRGVMLGICVGFFFLPWFSTSAKHPRTGQTVSQGASGWDIFHATIRGMAKLTVAGSDIGASQVIGSNPMPPGFATVAAGGVMMIAGPFVYVLGLTLAGALAFVAYRFNGRGAVWPFIVCAIGILSFLVGWLLVSCTEPISSGLDMFEANGISIGVSTWLVAMLVLMVPMCPTALAKPAPVR